MTKYLTLYQPNSQGEIEKIETVNGEVVEERGGECGFWDWLFSTFSKEERAKCGRPTDGTGREFNGEDWVYTAEANGGADPFQSNYEAPQDYQGSAPILT